MSGGGLLIVFSSPVHIMQWRNIYHLAEMLAKYFLSESQSLRKNSKLKSDLMTGANGHSKKDSATFSTSVLLAVFWTANQSPSAWLSGTM